MPGWYIHMDIARRAILGLPQNAAALAITGAQQGPSLADLQSVAKAHPSHVALGAIGPDIFFFLPDFEPSTDGRRLWGAAHCIKHIYDKLDPYLATFTDQFTALSQNSGDILNNFTGGLSSQIADTASQFIGVVKESLEIAASVEYDLFGTFGSGVQKGGNERVFFFSDMLHYRKTYQFAAQLWQRAGDNPRFQAFALGWMSHLAVDVTGHSFVNQKCGGPYRLHWQRHHVVENHMDGAVYLGEYGTQPRYEEISTAALHTWIAFDQRQPPESYVNFLSLQDERPNYLPDNSTQGFLSRRSVWDYESGLPLDLAEFVIATLHAVYAPDANSAGPNGPHADHPEIINALVPSHPDPFPNADDLKTTYWWLYRYLKYTTTDLYRFVRPEAPPVFTVDYANLAASFPAPPGTGASPVPATSPGTSSPSHRRHLFELAVAIFAWLSYLVQVVLWFMSIIAALVLAPLTWPLRELIYEFVQLPLYNAQMALHFYLSILGFTHPFKTEVATPLTTLGQGWEDLEDVLEGYLNTPHGGLLPTPAVTAEPSGSDLDHSYPHDVVTDPPSVAAVASGGLINFTERTIDGQTPTEFLRPWRWPDEDQQGDPIPSELPLTVASPYVSGQDATVLLAHEPGDAAARSAFETAGSEADTLGVIASHLSQGKHLGDPADYTAYLIATLTRAGISNLEVPNFNLDADRGYGYKCWDWVRSQEIEGVPDKFTGLPDERVYKVPLRPGFGWRDTEIRLAPNQAMPPPGSPERPTRHRPESSSNDPVRIRYIDEEPK